MLQKQLGNAERSGDNADPWIGCCRAPAKDDEPDVMAWCRELETGSFFYR
ncbi:hypothetical protein AA700_0216 [Acidiphilium acidophilum DSM 700]|nr:hypothetical protein AA700_0216 [Acidiphilium acidophilum DSM 700]